MNSCRCCAHPVCLPRSRSLSCRRTSVSPQPRAGLGRSTTCWHGTGATMTGGGCKKVHTRGSTHHHRSGTRKPKCVRSPRAATWVLPAHVAHTKACPLGPAVAHRSIFACTQAKTIRISLGTGAAKRPASRPLATANQPSTTRTRG